MDALLLEKPSSSHANIINRSTIMKGKSSSVLGNNDSSGNESDLEESRRPLKLKCHLYQSDESIKRVALEGDEWESRDMIADIFGESDNDSDTGDFEGFTENEVKGESASDYAETHWSERLRLRRDSSKARHHGDGSGRATAAVAAAALHHGLHGASKEKHEDGWRCGLRAIFSPSDRVPLHQSYFG